MLLTITQSEQKNIYVPNVGDNWKNKMDSAIQLIKITDNAKYQVLIENCDSVDFSNLDFSTTVLPNTIVITRKDIELNSINDLAAILVHESKHLYFFKHREFMEPNKEEMECYLWEYDFFM